MRRSVQTSVFLLASLATFSPAAAVVTSFAQYTQPTSALALRWVRSGASAQVFTIATPSSTTTGAVRVNFSFLQPYLAGLGQLPANLQLHATVTSTPATLAGSTLIQNNLSGGFSFTYTGATPLIVGHTNYLTGANLLSGSFTQGVVIGGRGATTGYVSAATGNGGTLTYTSDILDFTGSTQRDLSVGLASITAALSAATNAPLSSFRAVGVGLFSSDGVQTVAAIPEPASWAMMVAGFALLGNAMRRRRTMIIA